MQTTIKQQIKAVQQAKERYHKDNSPKGDNMCLVLNDAASTLAAVNMIGEDKIKALPDLIRACEGVLAVFEEDIPKFKTLQKLESITIQLKK